MKKILVIVDMQNDFIDGALGTKEAVGIVDKVVSKIKGFDGKILATLDTHYHNYMETAEGRKLPVPHCIRMTNGWLLNEKVMMALSDKDYKTIEKGTFGSTGLADEVGRAKGAGDIEVEFVGLCTDICVISNVLLLKAYFPEVKLTVDAGCCAGTTPESHRAAIEIMKSCQIDVLGAHAHGMGNASIDMGVYRPYGQKAYSVRSLGEEARRALKLDDKDADSYAYRLLFPKDTLTVTTSYFAGLLGKSVAGLGREAFYRKYLFAYDDGDGLRRNLVDDIEEGVMDALGEF